MTVLEQTRPASGRELADLSISRRTSKTSRRRALTLLGVYVLMALHIAHWQLSGSTVAPLELNEVMVTLELGIVTAGFIFMSIAVVSVLIFGRFFCAWGCHILALEDGCAWIMKKLGIRPRPLRSRFLLLVPSTAMFYMFIWPQVARLLVDFWPSLTEALGARPEFALRIATDEGGWASFVTQDFWRNLPGPGVALLTFLICGFAIVYLLGSRSFCNYGCPYGVLFGLADRLSPGQILNTGECVQCARCTAVCPSGIDVHREIADHGAVVSARCLKDLNCVSVCPTQGLKFGFGRPAWGKRSAARRYDFSWGEETLLALTFLVAFFSFRGLYGRVPFLMSLGAAAIVAYLAVLALRLGTQDSLRLRDRWLRKSGRLTRVGVQFSALAMGVGVLLCHSTFIRYHEWQSHRFEQRIQRAAALGTEPSPDARNGLLAHLEARSRWGLLRGPELEVALATAQLEAGQPEEAQPRLRQLVSRYPGNANARLQWARSLLECGRPGDARRSLSPLLEPTADGQPLPHGVTARAQLVLASISTAEGDPQAAISEYDRILEVDPESLSALLGRSELRAAAGDFEGAETDLARVLSNAPQNVVAHYNLGVVLSFSGRDAEAIESYRTALEGSPADPQIHNNLGFTLARLKQSEAAEHHLRQSIHLDPKFAEPHYNLARLLATRGEAEEAELELGRAIQLGLRIPSGANSPKN